jgi:fatty-acyl-CoA synthase
VALLHTGGTTAAPKRVIAGFWDLVRAHGITQAGSAPTTAAAIVASHGRARAPAGFSYWSGGATVPVQVAREFADKFAIPLREGWGMTELHGGLIFNPSGVEPRLGSIGMPFPVPPRALRSDRLAIQR